jgi:hypothetical protein
VPDFQVRFVAAETAFGEQDGDVGSGRAEALGLGLDQHVGEAGFEGKAGDGAPVSGELAAAVDRAEAGQPAARFGSVQPGRTKWQV